MHNDDLVGSSIEVELCGKIYLLHGKFRWNLEDDRLSSLPDERIHKILSFISIKEAVRLSVLSSRWRRIWTSMPYLNFQGIDTWPHSSKFVYNFLSRRNDQTQVYSLNLFLPEKSFCAISVKRVLTCAFSQYVQQLKASFHPYSVMIFTPKWDLPALTTLHLNGIALMCDDNNTDKCSGLLSKCSNLRNLSLESFKVIGTNILNICHPRLSNLTLRRALWSLKAVNVVAPQLKNLTIEYCSGKHMISAPGLTSLVIINGYSPFQLSTQGFPYVEKAYLRIDQVQPDLVDAQKIDCLLQQLQNVKFLTLNLEILELLSSSMERISHQPSPFANLKISSFSMSYPEMVCLEVRPHEKGASPTEMEIKVMRKIIIAQGVMKHLRELLGPNRKMHEHGKS